MQTPGPKWWVPLGAMLLLSAAQASAAECKAPTTISEAIAARHEFVMKAKVYRVRPPLAHGGIVPVMFSMIRAYRGAPSQIITVYFDPAHDARAMTFHKGDVMLVSTEAAAPGAYPGSSPEIRVVGTACTLRQLVRVSR